MSSMKIELDSYLFILIVTIFLILLWKAAAFVFSQTNVPGPKGNWLTGQLFEIMQTKDMMLTSHEWVKTYGPIVKYRPMGIFGKENKMLFHIMVVMDRNYCNLLLIHRTLCFVCDC